MCSCVCVCVRAACELIVLRDEGVVWTRYQLLLFCVICQHVRSSHILSFSVVGVCSNARKESTSHVVYRRCAWCTCAWQLCCPFVYSMQEPVGVRVKIGNGSASSPEYKHTCACQCITACIAVYQSWHFNPTSLLRYTPCSSFMNWFSIFVNVRR